MDSYPVTVLFKGGPLGGEVATHEYRDVRQGIRVPAVPRRGIPFWGERDTVPYPDLPMYEVHDYRWEGERDGVLHIMHWVSPIEDYESRIKALRGHLDDARRELGILYFEEAIEDDPFDDGLGGW